ncbi:FtsX-like permease family protein [Foetidibacter luteolus]|uniref:FtsX-like permease family protein n=1 Tax=Foetidibacter luteolus TaxID=2608880 RepID=UPI00129BCDF2|nr:FtsX-like permease family protein [Foetidibacter luteolus]
MFKNYITIALRTLWKNKLFTAINILGLAIGISASLVIFLLVRYDFSFDKFHTGGDRIYRIVSKFDFGGESFYNSGVTYPLGPAVKNEVTGLEEVAAFSTWDNDIKISVPVKASPTPVHYKKQKNIVFADAHYFNLVNYTWVAGSAGSSLQKPYQAVLAEEALHKYFPGVTAADAIGRELIFNDTVRTNITGIVKDITANTDFTFTVFIAKATLENTSLKPDSYHAWDNTTSNSQLFIKLSAGTDTAKINRQLAGIYLKYNKPKPEEKARVPYLLQPLSDVHFNNYYGAFDNRLAHKPTLYGLLAVAAFLLLLGCINFINLTTAYATQRAKEIGVRKTMGSSKLQLVVQFLSETFLVTFIATLLSVAITPVLLKVFSDFVPEKLHFSLTQQPVLLLFLLGVTVAVTLLSGIYPALVLSGYKPVLVLKNQVYAGSGKSRNLWLRKILTVSQFVIAQVFIMATILVGKQISYTLNKDLGFKKDAIVYFQTNYHDTVKAHKAVLVQKLKAIPGIAMISLSNNPVAANGTWSSTMKYKDGKKEIETNVQMKMGDTNYIKLYGLKLLAGKNLEQTDTITQFLINETYAHILGFQQPGQAIGKYIEWDDKPIPITGVVANFHQQSLHAPIKPIAIGSWSDPERTFNIALQPQNAEGTAWKTTLAKMEKAFNEVYPEDDLEYSFQDETIAKYYASEQKISGLLKWATGLAVFISCLGLLGLVIYTTTQRVKEIGVRKVLGASIAQLVALMSKEFILLVLLAFVIATPVAWYGTYKWLQNFSYRTELSWWIFLSGGLLMVVTALCTMGYQTIKAAMENPVKSLRSE